MRVMAYCDGENVERPLVAKLLSDLPDGGGRIQTPVAVMFRNRFVDGVPTGDIGVMGGEVRLQFSVRLRVFARFAVQRNLPSAAGAPHVRPPGTAGRSQTGRAVR